MANTKTLNFESVFTEVGDQLDILRQCQLKTECEFIRFCTDRGISVAGNITGEPGEFHKAGWLRSDATQRDGGMLFHPFRLYPVQALLAASTVAVHLTTEAKRAEAKGAFEFLANYVQPTERLSKLASSGNRTADLAILLEPVYWPNITSVTRWTCILSEDETEQLRARYKSRILDLVRTLEPDFWCDEHEKLRLAARKLDPNGDLYLLLRVSSWRRREQLRGEVSGAIWLRHIAEVIRRAFEECHGVTWPEEDEVGSASSREADVRARNFRQSFFGAERPLDKQEKSKSYLALNFGLFTGSVVRWYVEGPTEYYAICEIITFPNVAGIELVNLRGNLQSGRDNIALKLADCLEQDCKLRRFSIISFDLDVPSVVKAVGIQVKQGRIVGYIGAHSPDFEFANFTVEELCAIAAKLDEEHGFDAEGIRSADWSGIKTGAAFERYYNKLSQRKRGSLKGEEWGRALANFAWERPNFPSSGEERPFITEIRAALQARTANYDLQKTFTFDTGTFKMMKA